MHYLSLPITYGGSAQFGYAGFDTDSCVSDYFDRVKLVASSPVNQKLVFTFTPDLYGSNPPLEPGYGRLINIYFRHLSGSGTNILDSTTLSSRVLRYDADYIEFQPYVVSGYFAETFLIRGDANGDLVINILDVAYLINYLYKFGPAPEFYAGDADHNGVINMLDITYLISYLYQDGPPPPPK